MSDYRRCYVPGGSYFFTVFTERWAGILANDPARDCLRDAIRHCQQSLPFRVDVLVMLPDQIHAIWTMPTNECDYSKKPGSQVGRATALSLPDIHGVGLMDDGEGKSRCHIVAVMSGIESMPSG